MQEIKLSAHRKKMYDFIHQIIGRNLTVEEHDTFKGLIRDFFENTDKFVAYRKALNAQPVEHILTCGSCRRIEKAIGYDEHQKKRRKFVCS